MAGSPASSPSGSWPATASTTSRAGSSPGRPGGASTSTVDGADYPLGDLFFDCGGVRIGFEICEDAWVANRPGGGLALRRRRRHPQPQRQPLRLRQARGARAVRARRLAGVRRQLRLREPAGQRGRPRDLRRRRADRHRPASCWPPGRGSRSPIGGRRRRVVDVDATRMTRAAQRQLHARRRPASRRVRPRAVPLSAASSREPAAVEHADWETGRARQGRGVRPRGRAGAVRLPAQEPLARVRRLARAAAPIRRRVACLVAMMVRVRRGRAGPRRFRGEARLRHARASGRSRRARSSASCCSCVYQATRNSARRDARTRPAAWPRRSAPSSCEFDVDALVAGLHGDWSPSAIGRELRWETDDLALQNIQARVRAPGVWMLANLRGALLLATSNRSEAAVGYATMDGDTSGGLSPIAGIDKAFLRRWLRWLRNDGPGGPRADSRPCARSTSRRRPPSCGPQAAKQTDEADLMPYELLDAIERAAIRDKQHARSKCYQLMRAEFPQYDAPQLRRLGRAVLPPLVPQPVEARALRAVVPPRRREPRSQDLVPLPDPLGRLRAGAGGASRVRGTRGDQRIE